MDAWMRQNATMHDPLSIKIDGGADVADDLDRFFFPPLRGVCSIDSREASALATDCIDVFRRRDDMLLDKEPSTEEIDPSSVDGRSFPPFFV